MLLGVSQGPWSSDCCHLFSCAMYSIPLFLKQQLFPGDQFVYRPSSYLEKPVL